MRWALFFFALFLHADAQTLRLTPPPGGTVTDNRPTIQVYSQDAPLPPGSRLWVNGHEVTGLCLRSPNFVSYRPFDGLQGPVQVRFTAGALDQAWSFVCQSVSRISNLAHNAKDHLYEGEELVVSFNAEPEGKAGFRLDQGAERPMAEIEPGRYEGRYLVTSRDMLVGVPLDVIFRKGAYEEKARAAQSAKLFGSVFRVKILSPADRAEVDASFTITGQTRPNALVTAVPALGFNDQATPSTEGQLSGGTGGSIQVRADANGKFEMEYGMPLAIGGMWASLTIFATDDDGNRSAPTVVRYRFK